MSATLCTMTEREHGYADNYAGAPRSVNMPVEWLAGWDEAQSQRLQDEHEIRKVTNELQRGWVTVPRSAYTQ